MMKPDTDARITLWVNIYPDESGSESFATELDADINARLGRIGRAEQIETDLKTAIQVLKR
jgi:hypothetical protein